MKVSQLLGCLSTSKISMSKTMKDSTSSELLQACQFIVSSR